MKPEPNGRKTSIKTKVTITTFITVSLLVIGVSSTLFTYFHTLLKESIFKQQFVLVSEIAGQLNGRIEFAQRQLLLEAADIDSSSIAAPRKLRHFLAHSSPSRMIFDAGFLVIGSDGLVIAESMGFPGLVGKNLSSRDYVRESLRTGNPVISTPFRLNEAPRSPMIAMSVPVRDSSNRIICLLAGHHSLGAGGFLTSLTAERIGASGYLYLIQDRTILVHPDARRILEPIPEGINRGIDQALRGFEGSLDNMNSSGQRMLSSFKKVGHTGWILGVNIPYEQAFNPLKTLALTATLISIGGTMLSLVIVWLVTRRLTQPISLLTAHVDAAGSDIQAWQPIELHTGDETERLADAFNRMMKEVHDTKQLLKDEKDFFSGIIQNAAAPMFVIDSNHKIIFWNGALAKLTGRSSFQMIGTRQQWSPFYPSKRPVLADLVIDHTLERAGELYSSHSSSLFIEGSLRAEGWYENLGGKRRYIFFEAAPIKNSNNETIAAVETLEEITDRKLAEDSTTAHNLFLQEVMDAIPNPVYYKDTNGVYLGCNAAFKAFFGKTTAEIIGHTLQDIMSENYGEVSSRKEHDILDSGRSDRYETQLVRSDGMIRNILVSKAPFSNSDGTLAGVVGAFVDITEQRRMDEQIRKMSRAIEQSPATIVITDVNGVIEYVNPKFCQSTGYSAEEAIGNNPSVLKSGEMPAEGYANLWKTISSGKEWRGEFRNKRKDGSLYWEFASISPLFDKNGGITGFLAVKEDITARKADEAELARSRMELEKAYAELKEAQLQIFQQEKMASIGQLAAGVAHEINNPMGFISSNLTTLTKYIERLSEFISAGDHALAEYSGTPGADLLKETRKRLKIDYIMEDARQLIIESQDGAGRVRRIVQDLKSFSRVDNTEKALINLNESLETTINIAWNEIKYVADLNRDLGDIPEIHCYPQQLNQVFLNLLVNASHAMEGKPGSITVRTWCDGNDVNVSVTDTGCGIPAEIRQRIFEPFFTTKEVGKGTGLGLSISYDIIRKHGGDITVDSEPGQGTTFKVRLPLSGPPIKDDMADFR
ncbi:MAG: PAS domain S-box protein [Geobacteraceae bacterium]|nr:PAS domain S-box protein [Geobacteraceae bacterium]